MVLPTITKDHIMVGPSKDFSTISIADLIIKSLASCGSDTILVHSTTGAEVKAAVLLEDAVTLAEELRSRGLGIGSVIGICAENNLEYATIVSATLCIGATSAPLSASYTINELKHAMSISKPSLVFCTPTTFSKLVEVQRELSYIKELVVVGDVVVDESFTKYGDLLNRRVVVGQFQSAIINPKTTVAVLLCSSGTTGPPKCVELTHFNIVAFIESRSDGRSAYLKSSDVVLGLLPFNHVFGYGGLLYCLAAKIKLVVMPRFNEEHFLQSISKYKITILLVVPPLMLFLAKHPLVSKYDLSSVRGIRCGAAALGKELQLQVEKRLKVSNVVQGYGMTELTVTCCMTSEGQEMGSSGVVSFGIKCKVLDLETGKPLPPFKEGELCFKGPLIMKGYHNNKEATDEIIDKDGWLHTGDIAFYDKKGFLFIVDRVKELIKYKGFQVPPAELEAILLAHPEIKDAAVVGLPDEEAGELPLAFVVLQPGSMLTGQEIQQLVAGKVSKPKRLSGGVRFVPEIPKSPSGKILRRKLRELLKVHRKSNL